MSAPDQAGRPAVAAGKVDPESLILRCRPRPVARFRRKLIVGLTAAAATGLVALAWVALEPPSFRLAAGEGELAEPLAQPPADALAGAPANYGDAPKLGPPLPGDLGRPILEQQRSLAEVPPAGRVPGESGFSDAADARQRADEARRAARASALIVPLTDRQAHAPAGSSAEQAAPPAPAGPAVPPAQSRSRPSPWTLAAGTVIRASLLTGLNSDLPGVVMSQVTEPVFDSATGRRVLIPPGSKLIGAYDSKIAYGQRRVMLAWSRIVFPDGSSVRLDNVPASDPSGYSGISDRVDSHDWQVLKGALLSTLVGVGTQLSLGGGGGEIAHAIRESGQQNAARAGDQLVARSLDVQPTLTVRPGSPITAILREDLVLEPWE